MFSGRRSLVARGRLLDAWITNKQKGLVCFLRPAGAEAKGFLLYLLECKKAAATAQRSAEKRSVWLARGGDRGKGNKKAFGFKALLVIDREVRHSLQRAGLLLLRRPCQKGGESWKERWSNGFRGRRCIRMVEFLEFELDVEDFRRPGC